MPLSSFIISPEEQYQRDLISLQLLQQEKEGKIPQIKGLKVNSSKNPKKELWKDTGIDGEIARRKLIMDSLLQRMSTPEKKQKTQQQTQYPELLDFLRKALSGDYE